ncbi:hypothetical protein AXX12_09740 [Anaerosporomusa subterranea]|uniref:Porin domain-containing protein n=1 Tax=Anaerosporomusa subterranea TaxID=1794912 RepID=A0A154BS87_ANASB|nr:hypothetical protein [Anaerosporomusa subterranea]KYZ76690.1 hypothetical protein AXX12_09740 [Anaerosporomusa subterranea]
MKKTAAAAIAAALVLTTSAAFAAPVEFDGDVKAHYRWQTYNYQADEDGGKFTVRLNAKMELDKNLSVYARFAAQTLSGDHIGADFNKSSNSIATIDQYGFIYNNADWSYKIGRQPVAITAAASLLSSGAYIGEDMDFLNGIVATGKSGVTSLQVVAGGVDHYTGSKDDSVYSIHASYSPAKNWTVGGTLASFNQKAVSDRNFWGLDAAYTTGKASFLVDFLKSNASANDTARVFGVDYAFDDKNTLSVYNHKTEVNADILTDWDKGEKGFYYIYNHNFDKTTSFNLMYKDNKVLNSTDEYDSLRTTVTYKF